MRGLTSVLLANAGRCQLKAEAWLCRAADRAMDIYSYAFVYNVIACTYFVIFNVFIMFEIGISTLFNNLASFMLINSTHVYNIAIIYLQMLEGRCSVGIVTGRIWLANLTCGSLIKATFLVGFIFNRIWAVSTFRKLGKVISPIIKNTDEIIIPLSLNRHGNIESNVKIVAASIEIAIVTI
ncbi:hypothetical protein H8L32_21695 [Undibacterium sp. CY18W]|uniref:Uncharacterized protein n=1 Tax=Undibacterium hunanense TaxID=2762292 RepID=A0ABR6ZW50_9BURK|nr:hypothetical protein [Undibacterium hunanense]MBC3920096.1 hypothetical protein [Undibacterium hunanense]